MTYFLDTNICVYYLNAKSIPLIKKIDSVSLKNIKIPVVVATELFYGVSKSAKREYNLARYNSF